MTIQKIALAMTNMVQHQPSASHSASENRDAFYLTALVECIAKKLDEQDNLNRQLSAMQQRAENAEADAKRYQWIMRQGALTDAIFAYTKSSERHVSNAIDAAMNKEPK